MTVKPVDEAVPQRLYDIQKWFGHIIAAPLTSDEKIQPITPFGGLIEAESSMYITSNKDLKPYQRIQIYNQSYWWRLITLLQEAFPLVLRLLGYDTFNQAFAIPYLKDFPPDHWNLAHLGSRCSTWINKKYRGKDKRTILHAAKLDWAVHISAYSKTFKALSKITIPDDLPNTCLKLQPSVSLLTFPYHLFLHRQEILAQEVEYWSSHDLPKLLPSRAHFFVLCRSSSQNLEWQEITAGQHFVLKIFKKGASILQVCKQLEVTGGNLCSEAEENITDWFEEFVVHQWLYAPTTRSLS